MSQTGTMPNVSEIRLAGGLYTGRENEESLNPVNPNARLVIDDGIPYIALNRDPNFRIVAAKETGKVHHQDLACLEAKSGYGIISSFTPSGWTDGGGTAELCFKDYIRDCGIVWFTPKDYFKLSITDTKYISPSTVSPVLNGFIDPSSVGLIERDSETGELRLAELTTEFGADANVLVPAGSSSHTETAVNSVVFTDEAHQDQVYFTSTEQTEIRSGMVIGRKTGAPSSSYLCRLAAANGGLTTRVPGGMVIYENNICTRACDGYTDRRFLMAGPFVDPVGGDPMALTLAGPHTSNPSYGALIWMLGNNTFSGGLNLNNTGLVIKNDASLGAEGSPIYVSGFCVLRPYDSFLEVGARDLEIASSSALQLAGSNGGNTSDYTNNKFGANVKGSGDLILGYPCLGTDKGVFTYLAFELTGDHSQFEGTYYVAANVNGAEVMSPKAKISFANASDTWGVLRMSGEFTRKVGNGEGEVTWRAPSYWGSGYPYNGTVKLRGGFSAVGGDLVLNFGGNKETFTFNSSDDPTVLCLQDSAADGMCTMLNPIDTLNDTANLYVVNGKEATLAGDVFSSANEGGLCIHGGGTLAFTEGARISVAKVWPSGSNNTLKLKNARLSPGGVGQVGTMTLGEGSNGVALTDAVIEYDPEDLITFNKALELTGNCSVTINADEATMKTYRQQRLTVADVSAGITGKFNEKTNINRWRVDNRDNMVTLVYSDGTYILVR